MEAPRGNDSANKRKRELSSLIIKGPTKKPATNSKLSNQEIKRINKVLGTKIPTIIPTIKPNLNNLTSQRAQKDKEMEVSHKSPFKDDNQLVDIIENTDNDHSEAVWQSPKNPAKPNNHTITSLDTEASKNKFELLSNLTTDNIEESISNDLMDKKRTMPIFALAENCSLKSLTNILAANPEITNKFRVNHPIGNEYITIFTTDVSAFSATKNTLDLNKIYYYSFTPKMLKPKSLVLKGIRGGYSTDEILAEIQKQKKDSLIVNKIILAKFSNINNPMYIVQIDPKCNINELKDIKTLVHQKANWEHLKRHKLFQCMRCQRLGHASINCRLPPRCVKCTQNHEADNCPISDVDAKDKLKCANCNLYGHPASYKGCPAYLQAINIAEKKKESISMTKEKLQGRLLNKRAISTPQHNAQPSSHDIKLQLSKRTIPGITYANITCNNTSRLNHPVGKENGSSITSNNYHSSNSSQPPQWLQEFRLDIKNEIMNIVANMLNEFKTQISQKFDNLISDLDFTAA